MVLEHKGKEISVWVKDDDILLISGVPVIMK